MVPLRSKQGISIYILYIPHLVFLISYFLS